MLDGDQLEVFLAIAETRHFVRAADRLGIAQSVVSKRLQRLEDRLAALEADAHGEEKAGDDGQCRQPEGDRRPPPSPRVRVARSIRAAHPRAPPRPPGRSRTWRAERS